MSLLMHGLRFCRVDDYGEEKEIRRKTNPVFLDTSNIFQPSLCLDWSCETKV
jgi:hypothetical protein